MTRPLMSANTLQRLRTLARVMDDAVRVPGTNIRVGLDALIGLVPGVGDVAGGAATAYTIMAAERMGAPKAVLVRMVWNVLVDTVVGSVPFLGDLFDIGFKANRRNVQLLEAYTAAPQQTQRASHAFVIGMLALVGLIVAGGLAFTFLLLRSFLQAIF
jgi:hypothetical protein